MSGPRRRPLLVATAGVAAGAAVATVVAVAVAGGRPAGGAGPAAGPAASTARITRQTLLEAVTVPGHLGYGTPEPVTAKAAGTVTWLPAVGAVLRRGDVLLRADDQPVVLLYGPLPVYRPLGAGATGRDVAQLEANLVALGYRGFAVDRAFNQATAAAVKRWQHDLGLPETGTVDVTRVITAPGPIRVAGRAVRVGAPATGDVLTATATSRVVTVAAPAAGSAWAAAGTPVTVVLPGGTAVRGTVAAVGSDATAAAPTDESGTGTDPGTAANATVPVTVTVADQRALGRLASTPVDVRYTAQERRDVLTVPVVALLAPADGGYAVEVVNGAGTRIVPVQTGLFAGGQVEVRGPGLAAGQTVRAPG
jgi:peptidoglycan hydrolase-like protein with peptidoglycan-binding domain